jgi:hypothetical protein
MKKKFIAKKIRVSCRQNLVSKPETVFPLLCPKREYEWIAPWKCEILHSSTGFAELDCVFTTDFPEDVKETWLVDRYEPDRLIQFVRFSESRVIRYRIDLKSNSKGTTTATWEQTVISLNAEGNIFIDNFSVEEYENEIKLLEKMLNHYLTTNRMLALSEL